MPEGDYIRIGGDEVTVSAETDHQDLRKRVEPWLSAVLQSEHLALLVGNGLTTAIANTARVEAPSMAENAAGGEYAEEITNAAARSAEQLGRGDPNIEDRIRVTLALIGGLDVLGDSSASRVSSQLDETLNKLVRSILSCEREIDATIRQDGEAGALARRLLISFLMTFASRAASRERLNLFTTNYDRLVEYGCDLAGLRPLDRFVGGLEPVFR